MEPLTASAGRRRRPVVIGLAVAAAIVVGSAVVVGSVLGSRRSSDNRASLVDDTTTIAKNENDTEALDTTHLNQSSSPSIASTVSTSTRTSVPQATESTYTLAPANGLEAVPPPSSVQAASALTSPPTVASSEAMPTSTTTPTIGPSDILPVSSVNNSQSPIVELNNRPSNLPTTKLTNKPTRVPSSVPTQPDTFESTLAPTRSPTSNPINNPSLVPTESPVVADTAAWTAEPTRDPTDVSTEAPELELDGTQGALVTTDCIFMDYPYAIDVYWSCGDERFNNELRLHTFKRHSRSHQMVFNDQLLTYRDGRLWFDAYTTPRCIRVNSGGSLQLETDGHDCTTITFVSTRNGKHRIRDDSSDQCVGLGDATCGSDRSTGGEECGGVDHRFLPLEMMNCDDGLTFRFEDEAEDCTNGESERASDSCFDS